MWQIELVVGVLVLVFVGIGIYVLYVSSGELKSRQALQKSGTTTEATVISQRIDSHRYLTKNDPHVYQTYFNYYVTYQFITPNGSYTHEESVSNGTYHELTQGTKVNVTFLPANPDVVRLAAEAANMSGMNISRILGYILVGIGVLIGVIGGVFIVNLSNQVAQTAAMVNATATAVSAAKRAELATLRTVIDPQIPAWQSEKGTTVHQIYPYKPGADTKPAIQEVDYGYCSDENKFYAYLWTSVTQASGKWSRAGYAYYPDAQLPYLCHPDHWIVWDQEDLGGGWHVMSAESNAAGDNR